MGALLTIAHLTKSFPGQVALDDVDVTIQAGSTHALVGQNGSGKSTLIKILAGYHQPTGEYEARFGDPPRPLALGDGRGAHAAGIRFVHQDLGVVDGLSAVENVALGNGYETAFGGRINWRAQTALARDDLAQLGFTDFDVRARVGSLTPSQKTAVAIARALQGWREGASLLVLDEPTASLPGADVARLFAAVRLLKARGVAILYVSHHLEEVFAIADEVSILRDGKRVATLAKEELDHDRLIELMIGHRIGPASRQPRADSSRPVVLQLSNVSGGNVVRLDLALRATEVVGVAGINGSGREHIIPLVAGQIPTSDGHVTVTGTDIPPFAPRAAIKAGMASVPGDRMRQGIFPMHSVTSNLTIGDVKRHRKGLRLDHKAEAVEAGEWVQRLQIKTASLRSPIATLSGGNQQKVLFGKGLRLEPNVLVLDEPTKGIDVGAKEEIHQLIDRAARDGTAVLVASSDTEELVRLSQRVVVMRAGMIIAELAGDDITVANIEKSQLQTKVGIEQL